MNMKESINKVFELAGETVKLTMSNFTAEYKAIIQPMRYKNKLYMEIDNTLIGPDDSECFLYMGPAFPDFTGMEEYAAITTRDRAYNVSRVDRVSYGGETLYIWAVLNPRIRMGDYDCDS